MAEAQKPQGPRDGNKKLLDFAAQQARIILERIWPDPVEFEPMDSGDINVDKFKLSLRQPRCDTGEDPTLQNQERTIPELFQIIAGFMNDHKPDRHWVYDIQQKAVYLLDTVDYTEQEVKKMTATVLLPLPPIEGDATHYELREDNGELVVFRLHKDGKVHKYITVAELERAK